MCGIAGFYGDFSPRLLGAMSELIAHRGPDGSGELFLQDDRVGLAHRRLAIIDLSEKASQPLWDATHTAAIIYNGEVYNFKELREELKSAGYGFLSSSDTEVVLNLYLQKGIDFLHSLNGMFALAIWDTREKSLLIARDPIGVKPLYYTANPGGFLFASELKALLREQSVPREIDYSALDNYLTYLWCPAPATPFMHIKKLEPGHGLLVREGKIEKKWRYYDLPYDKPITPVSPGDAVEECVRVVREAVKRQLVADVPIGAFLSGGLDSSTVAAFMRESMPEAPVKCFSIGFREKLMEREGFADDLPYARKVAALFNLELNEILPGHEMTGRLESMLYHLEEPQADPAALHVYLISCLAREHGIKVVLSGAGGDDIFSGYRRHYALLMEHYWKGLPLVLRKGLSKCARGISTKNPTARRLSRAFLYADRDGDDRLVSYFNWTDPDDLRALYSDVYRTHQKVSPLLRTLEQVPSWQHPLNKMLYIEAKHFLADHNLNYTDKMSMAAGVEVRVPLLDRDVISFAAGLPVSMKQRNGTSKWILKKAMEPRLPREVIYRPKSGFFAPLRVWVRGELREMVGDLLGPHAIKQRGIFNSEKVTGLIERNQKGGVDAAYTIFSLLCIELWFRLFVDRNCEPVAGRVP